MHGVTVWRGSFAFNCTSNDDITTSLMLHIGTLKIEHWAVVECYGRLMLDNNLGLVWQASLSYSSLLQIPCIYEVCKLGYVTYSEHHNKFVFL